MAALWLRAIFHDAGTFDATDGSGGLDASLTTDAELADAEVNGGIGPSLATRFIPAGNNITKADMIALGGIVTVAVCGGPQVPFRTGRKSTTVANNITKLPSDAFGTVSNALAAFQRMGLTDVDMVTLTTGSHSLGGAHAAISPLLTNETFTPFDNTPGILDNDIFKRVLDGKCVVPIDCAFAKDPKLRAIIQGYANDQASFYKQFAISLDKMLSLSASTLSDPLAITIAQHAYLFNQTTTATAMVTKTSGSSKISFTAGLLLFIFMVLI
ncbi:hypothetical protein HDU99_006542 [Rhizoclosmatium hyalinum]|nr:hypothetical protein HDU99_006542 [Rhizoclosmatium hyalinum]